MFLFVCGMEGFSARTYDSRYALRSGLTLYVRDKPVDPLCSGEQLRQQNTFSRSAPRQFTVHLSAESTGPRQVRGSPLQCQLGSVNSFLGKLFAYRWLAREPAASDRTGFTWSGIRILSSDATASKQSTARDSATKTCTIPAVALVQVPSLERPSETRYSRWPLPRLKRWEEPGKRRKCSSAAKAGKSCWLGAHSWLFSMNQNHCSGVWAYTSKHTRKLRLAWPHTDFQGRSQQPLMAIKSPTVSPTSLWVLTLL